eukprot:7423694-Pyramimonas_sp.AAC.1
MLKDAGKRGSAAWRWWRWEKALASARLACSSGLERLPAGLLSEATHSIQTCAQDAQQEPDRADDFSAVVIAGGAAEH